MSDEVQSPTLPEAGFSATVKIVNPTNQFEWLVTTRAESAKDGLPRLALIEEWASKHGYLSFDAYVDQRRAERDGNGNQPARPANNPPVRQPNPVQQNGQAHSFQAESLEATVNKGKAYWKIKGGKFAKYGVTIWPEVLEETGFNLDELDPMQTYNLPGYTAHYTLKDDGKPEKVIKLNSD